MNSTPLIVPRIEIPASALPNWEQFPPERQNELIQALAALFLPLLQELEKENSHEQQQ
jgi:hypothetical protein